MSFYQLYELNHAAMAPWRAMADATRLAFQHPLNPLAETMLGPLRRRDGGALRAHHAALRQAGVRADARRSSTARRSRSARKWSVEKPFCSLLHFAPRPAEEARRRSEASHRGAALRPLRDAAARHRRGDAAGARRLHHRLASTRAWCRCPKAASISTTTSTTSSRCSTCSDRARMSWPCASLRCRCSPPWR